MKKIKKTTIQEDIHDNFKKLLEKHRVEPKITINFPEYKVLPVEICLALEVIQKHNYTFVMNFIKLEGEN